jgi:hypothetical protein
VDGTVASQTVDGFMLDAADGPHRVLVSGSTVFTGMPTSGPTPGLAVHVTGYLRGDGSILATRVRAGKK